MAPRVLSDEHEPIARSASIAVLVAGAIALITHNAVPANHETETAIDQVLSLVVVPLITWLRARKYTLTVDKARIVAGYEHGELDE